MNKKSNFLSKAGLLLTLAVFLFAAATESYAQRGGRFGGYGSYNSYRSYSGSYRSSQPSAMTPRYTQPSYRQPSYAGSGSGYPRSSGVASGGGAKSYSAPRALPKSITPNSPVERMPAFSGRVTKSGAPIIATASGKTFSIPQQGVMSSRMSLMSGVSKSALMTNLGSGRLDKIRSSFNEIKSVSEDQSLSKRYTSDFRLKFDRDKREWVSPAGVVYGLGSKEGNRVKHVLAHAVENKEKKKHSIFDVRHRGEILPLVDEAWKKRGDPKEDEGKDLYVVDMGRVVGKGGETKIKLVFNKGTNLITTAHPE